MSKRLFSPLKNKEKFNAESFSLCLLEKEIELEKSFRLDIIEDLVTLYSEAIEHYNEINDPKYFDYQDRLHKLLMKPEVSSVYSGDRLQNMYSYTKRKNLCNQEYVKRKVLETSRVLFREHAASEGALKTKECGVLLNVVSQESSLRERVNQRRMRKVENCLNPNDISTKASYYYDEKEQTEEIMEKYFAEKAKEIEDVTVEYMMLMDHASEGNKLKLAQEMNKKIISLSEIHDQKRIKELQKVKDLYRKVA